MADNIIEKPTPDQQATEVIDKLRAGKEVEGPLTPEVKRLATEKIQTLEASLQAPIRAALDKLRTDTEKSQTSSKLLPVNDAENTTEVMSIDPEKIKSLKVSFENEAKLPVTVEWLNTVLEKLNDEKDVTTRAIITSAVWSKLAKAGYIVSVNQSGTINIESSSNLRQSATEIASTLAANLNARTLTLADIQRAMIVGPMSFHQYLKTQSVDPTKASIEGYVDLLTRTYNIDLSKGGTLDQQIRIIQSSKASPEEKAVLISFVNGGFKNYSITPEIKRQQEIDKAEAKIKASPIGKAVEKAVENAGGGNAKAEKQKMKDAGEELTWNSFLDNPMQAITKYPWTSIGLIIGSIWQFGFGKTLLGLLGGFIGYNVADEWGLVDKMKKKEKTQPAESETSKKGLKKKPKVSVEVLPAKSIDKKGLEGARLVATERVEKNSDIASMIETVRKSQIKKGGVEIGDIADYMTFINNELQNHKASEIINLNDFNFSMFSDERMFDRAGQNNLDPMLLKRVLRIYLGVDMRLSPEQGKKTGEVEQQAFTEKYKTILNNPKSTLKDLVENIK